MTIYIHGFGSSGEGGKAVQFREYFKNIEKPFIAPSLSYVPELAYEYTRRTHIASYDYATLVLEEGGTHPYEAVERHFELIRSFLLENK